jgi:IPTL-CTERM motif/Chlamydia polymorphic membrane protein (Chlamydia_PMP) repeat
MGDTAAGSRVRGPFGELRPLAAALTLGFGLSLAPTTYAATFTVTNLNDSGAGSLRDAINQANITAGADTINFTVTGTITLTTGGLSIQDDVTITGPGAASLTVVPTANYVAFYLADSNPNVTISGLTIQGNGGTNSNDGGAITNHYSGNLTVQNSVISGNKTSGRGGAIYNYAGTVNIVNSVLTGNQAGGKGGAIYNGDGNVNITNSAVSGNTATGGGAIFSNYGAVSFVGSTVSGNQASGAPGSSGGALYATNGTVTIQNSTFSGNTAFYDGGALWTRYAPVTITNSTFSGNVAQEGGGGAVAFEYATVNLVSTILANSQDIAGTRDLFQFTVGVAGVNGHHRVLGMHKVTKTGTRPAGKTKVTRASHTAGMPHTSVMPVNATNSLIENDGGFINGTNINNILGQDPALGPLANNGGPTLTHALLAGSPAIDKGSNPNALAFDQRGSPFVRTSGTQTDIGAFEVQGAAPPPPPGTPLDIPTLSQWGTAVLSGLLGVWAAITGFGRRRRSGGS